MNHTCKPTIRGALKYLLVGATSGGLIVLLSKISLVLGVIVASIIGSYIGHW
ncbi:hypothetical protein [Clostridium sulfidigenes]|uniref:hypothetical protein n=1 Tax=Clostridium sulfidigenes TaxID=318464 RepID=UPI003F8873B1